MTCGYVAAGAFFFRQKRVPYFLARIHQIWARIMRARHGNIWHGTGSSGHGTEIFGTARIHQIWARHGTEDPQIYGTARHAKSWHGKILARPGTENIGTEKSWHGTARKKYHKIVFLRKIFLGRKIRDFLSGSKIPLLAIHKNISHIWEDRSRKVNNDEPDLRFSYGTF